MIEAMLRAMIASSSWAGMITVKRGQAVETIAAARRPGRRAAPV
ncbi:MAG TPA: hypothetical protein VGN82_13095 [Bosea sp. (in: a-proteobacteria)]|nr:hypothetical protein [Bosea sp. (in: a-proteobacteria)]